MRKSGKRVRQEAAAWIARLEGGAGGADREAFERWVAEDPAHREAYDRVAATYADAAMLSRSPIGRQRSLESAFPKKWSRLGAGLATAGLAGMLVLGSLQVLGVSQLFSPVPIQSVLLSSTDTGRQVRLEDGSSLTLAPASVVRVELRRDERQARVEKGRAHFAIVADGRPFVVEAGTARTVISEGEVMASLDDGAGSIVPSFDREVSAPGEWVQPRGREALLTGANPLNLGGDYLEFRATPLGEAVRAANRASGTRPIRIDPALAGLRVTGRYRSGDAAGLAAGLAAAFDLTLVELPSGTLSLSPARK